MASAYQATNWAPSLLLRVNPGVIHVQDTGRKWGSGSSARAVTLAIDLADKEPRVTGFVIARELLHLRVPPHRRLINALMSVRVLGWRDLEGQRALPRYNAAGRRLGSHHTSYEARR